MVREITYYRLRSYNLEVAAKYGAISAQFIAFFCKEIARSKDFTPMEYEGRFYANGDFDLLRKVFVEYPPTMIEQCMEFLQEKRIISHLRHDFGEGEGDYYTVNHDVLKADGFDYLERTCFPENTPLHWWLGFPSTYPEKERVETVEIPVALLMDILHPSDPNSEKTKKSDS